MTRRNQRRTIPLLLALMGGALWPAHVLAAEPPPAAERDPELDVLLTQKAHDILERVRLVDGQARSRRIEVSADIANGVMTVALDRNFLPADYGPSFEDQRSEISFGLLHWAEQAAPFSRVIFLYDGKEIEYYFPEIKAADDAAREAGGGAAADTWNAWFRDGVCRSRAWVFLQLQGQPVGDLEG